MYWNLRLFSIFWGLAKSSKDFFSLYENAVAPVKSSDLLRTTVSVTYSGMQMNESIVIHQYFSSDLLGCYHFALANYCYFNQDCWNLEVHGCVFFLDDPLRKDILKQGRF